MKNSKINEEKAKNLCNFFKSLEDSSLPLLLSGARSVQLLLKETEKLVYESLFSKIRTCLQDMPSLQQWESQPNANSIYELPTFSPSPLSYVTQIGEYLFTLPQQLEALHLLDNSSSNRSRAGAGGDDDAEEEEEEQEAHLQKLKELDEISPSDQASYWIDAIHKGTVEMVQEKILQIPKLSEYGQKQLASDLGSYRLRMNPRIK